MIIPGWPLPSGRRLVSSLSAFASAQSTAQTITYPADIANGDLAVLLDKASSGEVLPTSVVPTGYTSLISATNSVGMRTLLTAKRMLGTEGGLSLTGMNGATVNAKVMWIFRPNIPLNTFLAGDTVSEVTDGNPTQQTVNANGVSAPLLVLGGYGSLSAVNPRTFSTTKDGEQHEGANTLYLAYKIYNSSPADVDIDMDDEGSENVLLSCYLRVF